MWRRYLGSACARSHDCICKVVSQDPSMLRQSGCFVVNTSAPMPIYARVPGQKAKPLVTTVHTQMPDGNGSGEGPEDPREPIEVDKGRCYDVVALRLGRKLNYPDKISNLQQQFKQNKDHPGNFKMKGKVYHLGSFPSAAAAARCYDVVALKLGRKLKYQQQQQHHSSSSSSITSYEQRLEAYQHIADDQQFIEAYKQLFNQRKLDPDAGLLVGVDKEEPFRARVEMKGKVYHLGYFPSAAAAARCYDVAALRLGRKLNYPDNIASYLKQLEAYRHIQDDQQFIEAYLHDLKST